MSIESNTLEYMDFLLWTEDQEQILLADWGWVPVPKWMTVVTASFL